MKKQAIAALTSILVALATAPVFGAERSPANARVSGFYGGLVLRDQGVETRGLALGTPAPALSTFGVIANEDSVSRSLMYGGYRFGNDVAIEASVNSADPYALRPSHGVHAGRGLGLVPAAGSLSVADSAAHSWNVDVYTSWNFYRSFALYGRLGYAQTDVAANSAAPFVSSTDPRRLRDGVNYGLGVRYDVTSALGLRLEYGRFGRFAGDVGSTASQESEQVTFGLQFRF